MSFLKNLDIWDAIDKIVKIVLGIWEKVNKKVIGNIAFWLGLGLLIHDYIVEENENINPLRFHGGSIGMDMIALGIQFMAQDLEWNRLKIKAYTFGYIGLGMSWFAWATRIFPNFIRHGIFWLGIASMGYSWYLLNKNELGFVDKVQTEVLVNSFRKQDSIGIEGKEKD